MAALARLIGSEAGVVMSNDVAWEDLNAFRMSREAIDEVIRQAPGCTVAWVRRDGQPISVWVSHVVLDGDVYVTTTDNRPKTAAWRRDPRTSLTFAVPGKGAVTILGRVELLDDATLRRRFLVELGRRLQLTDERMDLWLKHMDSEGRVTGRIVPEKYITFDERKLQW